MLRMDVVWVEHRIDMNLLLATTLGVFNPNPLAFCHVVFLGRLWADFHNWPGMELAHGFLLAILRMEKLERTRPVNADEGVFLAEILVFLMALNRKRFDVFGKRGNSPRPKRDIGNKLYAARRGCKTGLTIGTQQALLVLIVRIAEVVVFVAALLNERIERAFTVGGMFFPEISMNILDLNHARFRTTSALVALASIGIVDVETTVKVILKQCLNSRPTLLEKLRIKFQSQSHNKLFVGFCLIPLAN